MNLSSIPAQVWVGNSQVLKIAVIKYLQSQFCGAQGCLNCVICCQIASGQFHNILWLVPEGSYKVEQVREVLTRLSLRLAQNEQFYFIFQHADCLNDASANSLLKPIEEPPMGYHFIFLTPRKELLLNTVLSRSLIKQFDNHDDNVEHEIFVCFTAKKLNSVEFGMLLEKYKDLTEQDSRTLLDQIFGYWLVRAKEALDNSELVKIEHILAVLRHAQDFPPMPGSSKIFWRNLYLQLVF